jgi:outer membrane lipoprotein carrier protein
MVDGLSMIRPNAGFRAGSLPEPILATRSYPSFVPMLFRLVLCALALVAGVSTAHAEDTQASLKRFADGVQTLSAEFSQTQSDEEGRVTLISSGRMWLARPGRFRWDYQKPYLQQMICDGRKIWLYDPDLSQVSVRPAEQTLGGTPAALLSQKSLLADAFQLQDGGMEDGAHIVRLLPKSADSDFKSIELWLKAGVPQRMRFHDQLGSKTDIRFSAIQVNARLGEELFRFTPPKGTEVVEGQ